MFSDQRGTFSNWKSFIFTSLTFFQSEKLSEARMASQSANRNGGTWTSDSKSYKLSSVVRTMNSFRKEVRIRWTLVFQHTRRLFWHVAPAPSCRVGSATWPWLFRGIGSLLTEGFWRQPVISSIFCLAVSKMQSHIGRFDLKLSFLFSLQPVWWSLGLMRWSWGTFPLTFFSWWLVSFTRRSESCGFAEQKSVLWCSMNPCYFQSFGGQPKRGGSAVRSGLFPNRSHQERLCGIHQKTDWCNKLPG